MFAGGTTWSRMEQVTSWHKIKTLIEQYCVYNIISLQNITLQIPNVTKSSILVFGKVSQIWLSFIYTWSKKANNFQWK